MKATHLRNYDRNGHARRLLSWAVSELLESRRLLAANPLITEFMAQNNTSITDEDGDHSDWVEIYNPNSSSLSLNGYFLSDKRSTLTKWKFPSVSLGARAYMIVWASGKNRVDPAKPLHTNFSDDKDGEYLGLTKPDGTTICSEYAPTFPPQNADISYGIPLSNTPLISTTSSVSYFVPQSDTLGSTWTQPSFDDSGWTTGTNGIGFDTTGTLTSAINTDIGSDLQNKNSSVYMRIAFNIADPTQLDALTLRMRYNDGFVAYLNGQQIVRKNAPSTVAWNSTANATGPDGAPAQDFDVSNFLSALVPGQNVLAVQGLNQAKSDADFLLSGQIVGVSAHTASPDYLAPTPGAINNANVVGFVSDTKFDHDRGFYSSPFDLAISTDTAGATIRYTIDGSAPTTSSGTIYTAPIHITTTTIVRAIAYKSGLTPTDVDAQTYIFPQDVIDQPANVLGYPNPDEPINNPGASQILVPFDYQMDPTIVNDPVYQKAADALESIPTLAIGMNKGDIFGSNGFYDTATDQDNVEKPISFEYIDPAHPEDNVQVNAGISAHAKPRVKRSMNIHFKKIYGVSKLNAALFQHAPLGGDSATDQIDQLILRAGNNRTWATTSAPAKTTYTEDEFIRQNQIAMTGMGVHGQFVHLYINGLYWGLYNMVERPDDGFTSAYLGGEKEDYFAISQDGAQSGDATRWNYMVNTLNTKDLSNSANYAEMKSYLDVQEYADYIIGQWYSGVSDWPNNNWWAGANTKTSSPFQFYDWDGEFMFNTLYLSTNPPASPPNGAWVHPYFQKGNTDNNGPIVRLWRALIKSPEFMTMFADRAYKALANSGALTDAKSLARWDTLNDYVRDSIIDESARWGDCMISTGRPRRTRDDDWTPSVKAIRDLIPGNADKLVSEMQDAGFYPNTNPATMSQQGGLVPSGYKLGLTNPNSGGTIYYTTDGSDPRLAGGGVSTSAKIYSGTKITINSNTEIKLRVKNGSEWSALNDAIFTINTIANLRVTELMYHPKPPNNAPFEADEYEFLELKNTGSTSLNLSGVQIAGGVSYTFGNVNLAVGQHILVVKDRVAFESLYGGGLDIAGEYDGKLGDSGDEVKLLAPDGTTVLTDFTYQDAWYPSTDGDGYSLVVVDPTDDPANLNDKSAWQPSGAINGTPGADESSIAPNSVVINELLSASSGPDGDMLELKNTTSQPIDIGGWFISDSLSNLKKFKIPVGTTLAAGDYVVFTETADFGGSFTFSSSGEKAYLSSADSTGALSGYQNVVSFGAADADVPFARYVNSAGEAKFVAESAATFGVDNAPPIVGPIVINEIQYHPLTSSAEFLELTNISNAPVDLAGWSFTDGITFTFGTVSLDPGAFALLTDIDPTIFRSIYRVPAGVPIFQYSGALENAGETVSLSKPKSGGSDLVLVDSVSVDDVAPWPIAPDGTGVTLAKKTASVFGDDPIAWQPSGFVNGTPGLDNATVNQKPTVNAGDDRNVALPAVANLAGSASDDGWPVGLSLSTQWSKASGPGSVVFADATKLATTASFSAPGSYVLRLTANDGAATSADDLTVTVTGTVSFSAKINFQPATAPVPAGYLVDSGLVFGGRSGGLSYGWKTDLSSQTRDRNNAASADQRYDTLIQTATGTTNYWEISVPIGQYQVHIVAGDPNYIDSTYKINVEGVLLINGTPTSSKHWFEATNLVNVSDGRLTITNATGASNNKIDYVDIIAVGTPPSQPQVSIAATDSSASEENADPGVFAFTRTGDTTSALTVNFGVGGSATNGSDYSTLPVSVTIPAGQTSTTLTVAPIDDALVESTETVTLTLSSSGNYTIGTGSATVSIADNDSPPPSGFSAKINFQPAASTVPSGYSMDSGLLYGARSGGLTYGWKTDLSTQTRDRNSSLSADQRVDTLIQTGTGTTNYWEVAVPNGQYQVHIVVGDPSYINSTYKYNAEGVTVVSGTPTSSTHWFEGSATVTVSDGRLTVTNATGASNNKIDYIDIQSTGTPSTPQVSIAAADANAAEAAADPGIFTLTRTSDTTGPLTVNCTITGSATNGTDYNTLPTSVTFAAGSSTATVTVTPIDDLVVDPNETVILTLTSGASYTVSTPNSATVTIADNESSPNLFGAKINFQLAGAPVPSGYTGDTGTVFGAHGSLQYGWNSDCTVLGRDRNSSLSPDQRYDTLNQMQYGGVNRYWELAVPNGTYQVHLAAGDPNYYSGYNYKITIENTLAINGTPTSSNRWIENTVTVNVTDGRLTINNASGAVNNRICFVDVQQLS